VEVQSTWSGTFNQNRVKQAFYAVLKEKVPKEETLQTLLVEVEFLVNNHYT
jgi:hypothetical protein